MNKFQTLSWLGATGLLLSLASCSNDEMPVPSGDKLTFTVSLPADAGTRAFSDGLQATNLNVAVYEAGKTGEVPLISTFPGGVNGSLVTIESAGPNKFTVTVPLARSAEYDVVFWAQSYDNDDNCPFTYNAVPQTVDVDYSKMAINNEASDAFYAKETGIEAGIAAEKDIVLHRPFAQVNIGAADYQEYTNAGGKGVTQTALTFTALPTTFDINKGTSIATENDADVTFDLTNVPVNETFPAENVTGVKYMAMAYVLAGSATSAEGVTDVTFTATNGAGATLTREYPSIPVQNNYRTNIYGRILTNINDFNVTINPIYAGATDWRPDVWDGKVSVPQQDEEGNYIIKQAGELAGLKSLVGKPGIKVILTTDIDLNGKDLPSIGTSTTNATAPKAFMGEFDGNHHTIKGITKCLFAAAQDFNLHDLTLVAKSAVVSPVIEAAFGNSTIDNVKLKAQDGDAITFTGTSNPMPAFGGFISTVKTSANITITNCTNYANFTGPNVRCGGGFVGSVGSNAVVTLENCNNNGNITANGYSGPTTMTSFGVGGIVGEVEGNATAYITDCNNSGNINWTAIRGFAGGIIGSSKTANANKPDFVIKDCTNSGNISIISTSQTGDTNSPQNANIAAGGIYGGGYMSWYPNYYGTKSIINCSNTGDLHAESQAFGANLSIGSNFKGKNERYAVYAGGIVGMLKFYSISITGCNNSGNLSVVSPEPTDILTPMQCMAGIINTCAISGLTLTGNTVFATVTMEGNRNPIVGGLYTWTRASESYNSTFPANAVIEGNVNNSSYPVSNR